MGTLRSVKKLIHPTTIDKNNPYAHPSHPNHDPKPVIPVIIKPPPRPRPVTDRDLLVQARIASGRDPETGRMIVPVSGNQTRDIGRSTIVQGRDEDGIEQVPRPMGIRRRLEDADMTPGIKTKEEEEEANMSMYNARASRQIKKTGNRYDLFVQEMALQLQYPTRRPTSEPEPISDTSAYLARIYATRKNMGTRYDLFVKEMKEMKAERERRAKEPVPIRGYFAPEPKMPVEYYAPSVIFVPTGASMCNSSQDMRGSGSGSGHKWYHGAGRRRERKSV